MSHLYPPLGHLDFTPMLLGIINVFVWESTGVIEKEFGMCSLANIIAKCGALAYTVFNLGILIPLSIIYCLLKILIKKIL